MSIGPEMAGRRVLSGDLIARLEAFEGTVVLGRGVAREDALLIATQAGHVRWEPASRRLWVDSTAKRYAPLSGDAVICIVRESLTEEYRLDVGASSLATLPVLAFDGATKRNRPQLQVGTLVYARVLRANPDMGTEVTCAAPDDVSAKDWVTRESVFGELVGGVAFAAPQKVCSHLMGAECALLDTLGEVAPFELAVGGNGRVWLSAESESATVLARQATLQSGDVPVEHHAALIRQLSDGFRRHDEALSG